MAGVQQMLCMLQPSFMQGPVFTNYMEAFHKHTVDTGRADGKQHVLVLDEQVSHLPSKR